MKIIFKHQKSIPGDFIAEEQGTVAFSFIISLLVLCGFVALALDIGHLLLVKSELQRTADAGAIAGVMGLLPYTGPENQRTPNWLQAKTKALAVINHSANKVDNTVLHADESAVDYGYWLLNPSAGEPQTLPKARPVNPASMPVPAVKVTLSKPVDLYFAPLIGVSSPWNISATAVAILPEAVAATNLPPIAVAKDVVYNFSGEQVEFEIDPSTQTIKVQSQNGKAGWFNLNGGNSVPSVRFSEPLTAATQQIYLTPGTEATLMHQFVTPGQTLVLPVVDTVVQKQWRTIIGFAAFKVESRDSNSMTGYFLQQYFDPNVVPQPSSLSGVILGGVAGTPKLVTPF